MRNALHFVLLLVLMDQEKLLLLNNYNYAPVFLSLREDERDGGFFMLLNME